ncbi:SDR family NAD(P)-dependent oxidoreductase [Streptomyces parvus]|uniref:SDR family NAD(P)-dependent oxidoreductase n=1 Tax=Streptomyces parvus TaxID=66428 RepID=UPI0033D6E3BE
MTHYDNDELEEKTTAYLKGILSESTKLPFGRVDVHAAFESFGIDSVMAMTMTTELESVLGPLPKTLFFEYGTLRELAGHLVSGHAPELLRHFGARAAQDVPAVAPPAPRTGAVRTGTPRRKPLASTRWSARPSAEPVARTASRKQAEPAPVTPVDDRQGWDIAVIGLAGRYPGARTPDEFWANLEEGRDSVTEIPADRWDHRTYFDVDPDAPGRTYSKWGGFLDGVAEFDPLFFNISPAEAELMDPQERLFLQCVHETLENAGYTPARLNASGAPSGVGVYVGVMYEEYQLYGAQEQALGNPVALSGNPSAVANRVSYSFDFRGPSMSVDTMCSSSLTAIHLACQAIRSGTCAAAVAGGVNVSVHPNKYLLLGQGKFVSGKGRCESFGKGGDGYVPAEGVGAVLLKPLERALRDGDHIHGVIRSVAVNHGGRTNGYSVPSPVAQARSVSDAWRTAGIDPRAVSCVEAHGTGTALGDPIEIAGLTRAFREHTRDTGFCSIGSVKSNIGHAESAAGISGLTKVLLQMRHGKLAPSLHSAEPNPNIDFASTPFRVQQTLEEWRRPVLTIDGVEREFPRIAGVSSFGAGGSNAHLVVEEFVPGPQDAARSASSWGGPELVVLSARTAERLREQAERLAGWIETRALSTADLPSLARTLQAGRVAMRERLAVVVDDMPELRTLLLDFAAGREAGGRLVTGRADGDTDELARLAAAEDLTGWLARRDLPKLLDLWIRGVTIDWDTLHPDGAPRRIALPTYPFARDRHWIDTSRTAAALAAQAVGGTAPAAGAETGPGTEPLLFTETWEPEALPSSTAAVPRVVVCLCTPGERGELSRAARDLAPTTTLVSVTRGPGFARTSEDSYEAGEHGPDDLARVLEDVRARYGTVDGLLNLWPLDNDTARKGAGADPGAYTATVSLLQAIARAGTPVRVLQAGTFRDGTEQARLESWLGFERSLGRVLPDVEFAAVLADARDAADAEGATAPGAWFARLWGELRGEQCVSTLHRDGVRHVSRVRPSTPGSGANPLRSGGTYLVTGGTGGLGLLFAEHLARTRGARLVLTGRSPLDDELRRRIARVESLGAEVLYGRADAADPRAMREVVAAARERFGPIHGVVHAAGVAGHGSVLTNDARSIHGVVSAKVDGTLALDDALAGEPLDFVCYFSSTSAVLGDFGSCDYAVANRFQTAYAHQRQERVRRGELSGATVAIDWPLWRDGGMGFDDAQGTELYLSSAGLRLLEEAEGIALFERLLGGGAPRQIVLAGEPDRIHRLLGTGPDPVVRPHAASPARTADTAHPAPPAAPTETENVDLDGQVLTDLETMIGETLRVPREQIPADENLSQLGFDSVSLAKLAALLSRHFAIEVLPSVFFSYPTPQKLVAHLTAEHGEALRRHYAGIAPTTTAPATTAPDGVRTAALAGVPAAVPAQSRPEPWQEPEPIAVVGMSGRFPAARSVDEFWRILLRGEDVLSSVPEDRRADWGDLGSAEQERVRAGFLPGVAEFDPAFFEISPREARTVDPRQRLLLQEAWRALEDAGYGEERLRAGAVGMFVGAEQGDYGHLTGGEGGITSQHEAIMASRLGYFLDFSGPVLAVNTACSSGLAAAHQACASLRDRECDTAVVAGVNLTTTSRVCTETGKAGMLSESGVLRAFDTRADGMLLGEAVAVVVLKRLSRAEADGDRVLAVIRGSGLNYDGRTNGITAPSGAAQARLCGSVHRRHGIDPGRIEHIVAHGTGTRLGDPVEVNALNEAFKPRTDRTGFCALTSTKGNVGHTLAASGLVSLIALVQSLRHGVVPASPHCEQDSDYIAWKNSPFYVNKAAKPWPAGPTGTRLGAVSSFGMSGTNVHMVVESHAEPPRPAAEAAPARLLLLSAKTPQALDERIRELRQALADGAATGGDAPRLDDTAHTLLAGRHHFAHRCALVVRDGEDALTVLAAALRGEDGPTVRRGEVPRDRDRALLDVQAEALLGELAAPGIRADRYRDVLGALADLYCRGAAPQWPTLFAGERPRFVTLPGYPFARSRHWATDGRPAPARPSVRPPEPAPTTAPAPVAAPTARAVVAAPVPADVPGGRPRVTLRSPDEPVVVAGLLPEKPRNIVLGALSAPSVSAPAPLPAPVPVPAPVPAAAEPRTGQPGVSLSTLRQELRAGLAEVLYVPESDIDISRNFMELGLDSIVGAEWIKDLNKKYGLALAAARLYDHPSVSEFADFLRDELTASAAPAASTAPVASAPAVDTAGQRPAPVARPEPEPVRPRHSRSEIVGELRDSLADALFLDPGEVDARRSFVELGMDSIIGAEWVKALNKTYGTELTATRLYDHPTLLELAALLEEQIPAGHGAGPERAPATAPAREQAPDPVPPRPPTPVREPADPAPEHRVTESPAPELPAPAPSGYAPRTGRPGDRAAVIGMSGRYPDAANLREYWANLRDGRDSVREVPTSRWDAARHYDPRPGVRGTTVCKWMGHVEDADCFDPLFFNISPAEAEGLDPQQRLFLQEAYRAFEDAGYDPRSLSKKKCGVFLGVSGNEYSFLVFREGAAGNAATSGSNAIAAARIAYFLNLKGPAIALDTACSSSLVALHLAQQALAGGEIDIALVGGVSLYLLQDTYVGMSEAGMLSPRGRCRPFDNGADGFVPGEGVGALVLKRLADAEADHDHVYGVLLASGTNQDGKTNGITAPSAGSQMELIRTVYDRHGIDAASIGYVEMHGTGTRLGDPIELDALATVYRERGAATGSCVIGSVKSNIGHTSAAAGVAGIQKVLLAMRHGLLVPSLHFETPNEHFAFDQSPLRVGTGLERWQPQNGHEMRRAAVSSFGFSGTNAHVVLEEYRHA